MRISNLILIVICFLSCKENNNTLTEKDEAKQLTQNNINVTAMAITSKSFHKQILSNGVIEARQKSELRFKTDNKISIVHVTNGQKVNKGQLLATLDNELLVNQLEKARIEFEKAQQKLLEEKINYGLGKTQNQDIKPQILKNLHIKSKYLEAQNALENAQLLYKQTILKAPFSGVVANVEHKMGEYITSGDVFCIVMNLEQLEVIFSIMENELSFVKKGQQISIVPFVDEDKSYSGEIVEINPLVNGVGFVKIKARVNNPDSFLLDGMNVKITINRKVDNVLVIPKEAVVLRSNKEVVFTVKNGQAKWNYIKILDENTSSYAIKEGLKIGDTIIVAGNMNLAHDAKVKVQFIPQEKDKD